MLDNDADVATDTEALEDAKKTKKKTEDTAFLRSHNLGIKEEDVDEFSKAYYAA